MRGVIEKRAKFVSGAFAFYLDVPIMAFPANVPLILVSVVPPALGLLLEFHPCYSDFLSFVPPFWAATSGLL